MVVEVVLEEEEVVFLLEVGVDDGTVAPDKSEGVRPSCFILFSTAPRGIPIFNILKYFVNLGLFEGSFFPGSFVAGSARRPALLPCFPCLSWADNNEGSIPSFFIF